LPITAVGSGGSDTAQLYKQTLARPYTYLPDNTTRNRDVTRMGDGTQKPVTSP